MMKCCTDYKDELLNAVVDQPHAGQHLMAIEMRMPYQLAPEVVLIDLNSISSSTAAALLSEHSSQKTATTSADVGSVSKLSAIALAVRNRSYNTIAAFCSYMGAARFCKIFKRASNLSVPLVNDMGAPLVDGKVESPHRTAKASTRPLALLAAALAALTLTACGDCPPDDVVAITAPVTTPTPAPVQTPAPAPVVVPTPTPAPQPEPITYCPQSSTVVCPPSPTPVPLRPIVVTPPIAVDDYGDCRCDQAGNLTCTNPNPPPYIFCPPTPRPNPAACVYECNNDSGPVSY